MLSDQVPLRYKPVRLKNLNGHVPSRLEIGFNHGALRFPTALVTGQNVDRTLRTATFSVRHVEDFRDLPVPFVAVATDLVTGELVTLAGGHLASAIRASMSIPGAFSPVEIDGRILVDGGLVRNLPVDVVREMGADVVIAVDLPPPLYEAEELRSALEISGQTLRTSLLQNTVPQKETPVSGRDVLIRPDVEAVPITDFRSLTRTIPAGAAAARALADELAEWSVDSLTYNDLQENRTRVDVPLPTLDFVRIEGAERIDASVLVGRLDLPMGEPLTAQRLERGILRVFAMELFQSVDYTLVEEQGRSGLVVEVVEKPWGLGFL
jgi:NTE family protein